VAERADHVARRDRAATRPSLVIFDCDGVLVDSERLEPGTLAEALTWVSSELDAVALHDRHRGGVLADIFADIEHELGRPLPDGFATRYRALQFERLGRVGAVPGAPEVVDAVVGAGLPRCVVSGGPMDKMRVSLRATGLWPWFEPHIYSCYDLGDHKPSPGIYLHALRALGVAASDAIAIEDSVNGVTAAAAAGVRVIGLARDTDPEELRRVGAVETVTSMHDVLAAGLLGQL
jgi:beta-phosphoglucomutase-like phosphatase (HAD superfamily)